VARARPVRVRRARLQSLLALVVDAEIIDDEGKK
jgi:hypothetical protein